MSNQTLNRRDVMRLSAGTAFAGVVGKMNFWAAVQEAGPSANPALALADTPRLAEDYQVLQRDGNDRTSCLVAIPDRLQEFSAFRTSVIDEAGRIWVEAEARSQDLAGGTRDIVIENIPTGGPYVVEVRPPNGKGGSKDRVVFRNILVGDIWILGGQSNMYGIALLEEKLPALPYLNMLNVMHTKLDSHWCAAIPPIHRRPDQFAPPTLRTQFSGIGDEQIKQIMTEKTPVGGVGPAYFFAQELHRLGSEVPLGVIPCAHGAALAIWDPAKRDQNRYGFLHHQIRRAGGRVKGMLWYQGEQDAIFGDENRTLNKPSLIYPVSTYAAEFKKFIRALRDDFHNPELVVITAQICRHHQGNRDRYRMWERVREIQRLIPEQISNVHVVPTVDLDLLDGLHLDYCSEKRLGRRMAQVAHPYTKEGVPPRGEIKLKSVRFAEGGKLSILVEFEGVTGKLQAPGRPTGFRLREARTGEDLDWIFKADFDPRRPNVVLLRMNTTRREDLQLVYAPGATPYVNIVDQNDMAAPAFGPIEVK